uniref:Si:dkey-23i12.7 n=1 Tax=Stegastes partitus TaxID=144197 RepID=A0A3B5AR39_9TELE
MCVIYNRFYILMCRRSSSSFSLSQPLSRGTKRREKNRDAARKSRKKQTERADELHEELERSNAAFKKEIAALRKELHLYQTSLERHEPHCRLAHTLSSHSLTYSAAADHLFIASTPRKLKNYSVY